MATISCCHLQSLLPFLERATAAHAAMQDCQKVYSTWMNEYLTKKQKAALAHKAYPQPLRRAPGDEV
jgi:hypothetical protein